MKSKALNNKAQVIDLLYMPYMIAGSIIGFLILIIVATAIYPPLLVTTNQSTTQVGQNIMAIPSILDSMGLGIAVALCLVYIISAVVIKIHPVTFGIGLIILVFAVYLGGVANNFVETMVTSNNTMIQTAWGQATGLQLLKENMVTIIIGVGSLSLILSYLLLRGRQSGDPNAL